MKRILIIAILWLAVSLPLMAQNTAALIGISQYQPGSGWRAINAHNDVELIKSKLSPLWEVIVLENESATHKGIIKLLDSISGSASPGDTVYIHFSCHGQQMVPITIDSIHDPDLLDEALVPYDALQQWSSNYDGCNHLRDDELSEYINSIRDKVGVNGMVVVVLDACHSDSMERGDGELNKDTITIFRGTSKIFGNPIAVDSLERYKFNRDTSIITINNNSEVVYISACQTHSQNAEIVNPNGIGYGSLSYSIANALQNSSFANIPDFLDKIVVSMDSLVPYQAPGIRASFAYTKPGPKTKPDKTASTTEQNNNEHGHHIGFILFAAILTLTILIWRIKKK